MGEGKGTYSRRQKVIILKRVQSTSYDLASVSVESLAADKPSLPPPAPSVTAEGPTASGVYAHAVITGRNELPSGGAPLAHRPAADSAQTRARSNWWELPEIILFWARNRRRGGNLVVCPEHSMDRLIEAYLVCEVVEKIETVGWVDTEVVLGRNVVGFFGESRREIVHRGRKVGLVLILPSY